MTSMRLYGIGAAEFGFEESLFRVNGAAGLCG